MLIRDGEVLKPKLNSKNKAEHWLAKRFEELKKKYLTDGRAYVIGFPEEFITRDKTTGKIRMPGGRGILLKSKVWETKEEFGNLDEQQLEHTWQYAETHKIDKDTKEKVYLPKKFNFNTNSEMFYADRIELIFFMEYISKQNYKRAGKQNAGTAFVVRDEREYVKNQMENTEKEHKLYEWILSKENSVDLEKLRLIAQFYGLGFPDNTKPDEMRWSLYNFIKNKVKVDGDKAFLDFKKQLEIDEDTKLLAFVQDCMDFNCVIYQVSNQGGKYWVYNEGTKMNQRPGDKVCDIRTSPKNDLARFLKYDAIAKSTLEEILENIKKYEDERNKQD